MDRSAALLLAWVSCASAATAPFSVPASEYWDGVDGQWSSFSFQVGSPFQQIRLFPSTSGSTFAPIISQGCGPDDPGNCPQTRGGVFNTAASSTWSAAGTYQYTTPVNQGGLLGNSANASYGTDSVTLAWPGTIAPQLSNQLIAGLVNDNQTWYYLGQFGLSARAQNITSLSDSRPTVLANMRSIGDIPSTTWAYTAGFHNQDTPIFGSLTLGGYDTSRFRPNDVSFPFGPDVSRDLLVGVQRITSDKTGSTALMPTPAYAYIDSELPRLVLPADACTAFERAFNLTYFTQLGQSYYFLTDQQHQNLLTLNPSFTFTLGPALAGGQTVDINIPYAAFDLQLSPPLGQNGTRYFPLQRGANSSQYVLGRAFLQHAYVIADYDRSNFSVSQALFPQSTATQIQAIYAPGTSDDSNGGLSGGAIGGIVVGVIGGLAVVVGLAVFFWLRKRRAQRRAAIELESNGSGGAAPAYDSIHEKRGQAPHSGTGLLEAGSGAERSEMGGSKRESRPEMDGGALLGKFPPWSSELDGGEGGAREMDGEERARELDAGQTVGEMDGGSVRTGADQEKKDVVALYELA